MDIWDALKMWLFGVLVIAVIAVGVMLVWNLLEVIL